MLATLRREDVPHEMGYFEAMLRVVHGKRVHFTGVYPIHERAEKQVHTGREARMQLTTCFTLVDAQLAIINSPGTGALCVGLQALH
jgi:hypothetical protein